MTWEREEKGTTNSSPCQVDVFWKHTKLKINLMYFWSPYTDIRKIDILAALPIGRNSILLPKLFWTNVRKKISSDKEKLWKFEAEVREFAKFLRSLEQFFLTVGQNNFGSKIPLFPSPHKFDCKCKCFFYVKSFFAPAEFVQVLYDISSCNFTFFFSFS